MRKIFLLSINIILLPFTILNFFMPILVYFMPFMDINLVSVAAGILIILWVGFFLFSIIFLSSYCGFLCPITKIFEFITYITKNNNILQHRFPRIVGTIIPIVWLTGVLYVFVRWIGNKFGFLPIVPEFSHIGLWGLLSLYAIAAILIKTKIGRDELGHYLCPLSPFIKAGIELNKFFKLPGFRVVPYSDLCISCRQCNKVCSYQNNVMTMIQANEINYKVCSNCGKCINVCRQNAIRRKWTI